MDGFEISLKSTIATYRRPTFKCVVKRLRFHVFNEIANSIIAFWAWTRPHVLNTLIAFVIIASQEKIRIHIYCILAFKCGPTV